MARGNPPKAERNRQLVKLRDENPEAYSFRKLGGIFNIKESTAHTIYKREKNRSTARR